MGTLDGKKAFVTGGSGDIGRAIARTLAGAGAEVIVSYVGYAEGADATLAEIAKVGSGGDKVQLDQRDPASIEHASESVVDRLGGLDILVNNAAWNIGIPYPDLDTCLLYTSPSPRD